MDNPHVQIVLGIVGVGYGLYTLWMRLSGQDASFSKLEPMKQNAGFHGGNIIHIAAYTLLPIVFGLAMLYSAWSQLR